MDVEPGRDAAVEVIKKREKFLVAMARLTQGNHFAIKGIECREQGRSAVAVVIVRYSFDIAQPHRQHRLGTFQRLDLALFVYTQHQRLVRRIKVQTHDVAHLLHEERVSGELEALAAMRLQTEQREITAHCALGMWVTAAAERTLHWVACSGLRCTTRLINSATFSSS